MVVPHTGRAKHNISMRQMCAGSRFAASVACCAVFIGADDVAILVAVPTEDMIWLQFLEVYFEPPTQNGDTIEDCIFVIYFISEIYSNHTNFVAIWGCDSVDFS